MAIEVYTTTKPAHPRRAVAASIGLLIVVALLAWTMAQDRAGHRPGQRIEPAGWSASFECPPEFQRYQVLPSTWGAIYRFYGRREDGSPRVLELQRIAAGHRNNPLTLYIHVVRMHLGVSVSPFDTLPCERHDKKLGPFQAVELWDPLLPNVVLRVASVPTGESYAVVLIAGARIDPSTYTTFDDVCTSVQYQEK